MMIILIKAMSYTHIYASTAGKPTPTNMKCVRTHTHTHKHTHINKQTCMHILTCTLITNQLPITHSDMPNRRHSVKHGSPTTSG